MVRYWPLVSSNGGTILVGSAVVKEFYYEMKRGSI